MAIIHSEYVVDRYAETGALTVFSDDVSKRRIARTQCYWNYQTNI